jgi:hypothetical protein
VLHEADDLLPLRKLEFLVEVVVVVEAFNAEAERLQSDVPKPATAFDTTLKGLASML